jgi:hypothetical protein
MKRRTVEILLLTMLCSSAAMGQINCLSGSATQKLVCEFPLSVQVFKNYTALGAGTNLTGESAYQVAEAINVGIATQVSQLPLSSASAGAVVVYHAGVPETFNNLGPILTDRAQTVGKHRLYIGFTASQFVFTDVDAFALKSLPFAFEATAYEPGSNQQVVVSNTVTSEQVNLSFKINQFIAVGTYGLTKRADMSVIVPIEYVSLGATTNNSNSYILNASNQQVLPPYTNPNSYASGTASGVGDITINGKGVIWEGERATVSAGLDLRTPTGDDRNLLGSGAWGFTPYLVYSYLAKISPHAKFGYEWNTATELNNTSGTAGGNKSLPGGMEYDLGADWAMSRKVTVAGDILGSQFLNTPHLSEGQSYNFTNNQGQSQTIQTLSPGTASYTINNASVGLKFNPARNLVLSANGLFQLNNTGLRSRPTPLIGISYKF